MKTLPPVSVVRPFLPPAAVVHVESLLAGYDLHVRIARPRRTKLGDHRPPAAGWTAHRISINANLNPYAFLTTLLHEVAHAATWERHRPRRRVRPHGPEWKREFEAILSPVVGAGVLPDEVAAALAQSMRNPAAATCSDRGLALALARYDEQPPGRVRVEDLVEGTFFRVDGGQAFRADRQVRTRRKCFECGTGREYRVHGLLFVEPLDAEPEVTAKPSRPRRRRASRRLRRRAGLGAWFG
ncbi:MAG: SprT-like domain-containing protein [Planctomycetia bacterium]|nr:SprT-like domain-containing protein [Planctomycetia bacterium]